MRRSGGGKSKRGVGSPGAGAADVAARDVTDPYLTPLGTITPLSTLPQGHKTPPSNRRPSTNDRVARVKRHSTHNAFVELLS